MATGCGCLDILNLGLFRPIFSPSDFVQIKGRGTREPDFREEYRALIPNYIVDYVSLDQFSA